MICAVRHFTHGHRPDNTLRIHFMTLPDPPADILHAVQHALAEDIGSGDITAALIPETATARAVVIAREAAVLCGTAWFNAAFNQLDSRIAIDWHHLDGDDIAANARLCVLRGPARPMLTGERTALNFLQTLSGTATLARRYVQTVAGTGARVLDTRKTIPGLRSAQKYATAVGGCMNHRHGLHDSILIKENHIAASGSIREAIACARQHAPHLPVEVEVENLDELHQALAEGAEIVLLDNFAIDALREAVDINRGRAKLEASGGISLDNILAVAGTGVDFISVGALTKNVRAIDLSMRFEIR